MKSTVNGYLYIRSCVGNLIAALSLYKRPVMLRLVGIGFANSLSWALVYSVILTYLADNKVDLKTVGLFSVVSLPHSIKFLWAPLLDNISIPYFTKRLGLRKSWLLLLQSALMISIYSLGQIDIHNIGLLATVTTLIAFISASQDTITDAFRIEMLSEEEQAIGVVVINFGCRIGLLTAGAGSLFIAHYYNWQVAYTSMALLLVIGMLATLSCKDARRATIKLQSKSEWVKHAFIDPFADFLKRAGWYNTILLLVFYKIPDTITGVMTNPFLLNIGFDKKEIASIAKLYGVIAILLGFLIGGAMLKRFDYKKALFWGGMLQILSNLAFVVQAKAGHDLTMLIINISIENVAFGIGSTIFFAYIGHLCNHEFTTTQYACFIALTCIVRTTVSACSGVLAQQFGWFNFFSFSILIGLPFFYFLRQEFKVRKE